MGTIDAETLIERLQWRYATKRFDATKKIPLETWQTLEKALTLSPSSYGLQPWHFFVITDAELRMQLRAASWDQSQITDASHLVVLAAKTSVTPADVERYIGRIAQVRGVDAKGLQGYKQMMIDSVTDGVAGFQPQAWSSRQVYIALGFLLSAAALLGVDACPMEGFDAAQYNKILGLTERGFTASVVCTLGYRAADDSYATLPKVRFGQDEVIERR